MKSILILGAFWSAHAAAEQHYIYTTKTMTECFSASQTNFGQPQPTQGSDNYYTINMPECKDCDCSTCSYTHTYSTVLDAFNAQGVAAYTYSIKEVYRGMSAMPAELTPTDVPYGFTAHEETCTSCGDEALTAVMTFPRGGSPYQAKATDAASRVKRPSTYATQQDGSEGTDTSGTDGEVDNDADAKDKSNQRLGAGAKTPTDDDDDEGAANNSRPSVIAVMVFISIFAVAML